MAAANSLCLLKPNPPTLKCIPARFPMLPPTRSISAPPSFRFVPIQNGFPRLSVSCCLPMPTMMNSKPITSDRSRRNPIENNIIGAHETLQKPAVAAILIAFDVSSALAASGGRVGGSSFSSSKSSSSSSDSSSSSSSYSSSSSSSLSNSDFIFMFAFFVLVLFGIILLAEITNKTTVLKLQVGLLDKGRSLQKDLNRIAGVADTSTPTGLSFVLTKATLALLRNPDYCFSGYSSVDEQSTYDVEKRFKQLSLEERVKFDEETLVNVNSVRKQSTITRASSGISNDYIVITILVAAKETHKLQTINKSGDLKEPLQKLGSIPSSEILAVEVLLTPQNENDSLSEQELLEDYPLLRPL